MKIYAIIEDRKFLVDECDSGVRERLQDFSQNSKGILYFMEE